MTTIACEWIGRLSRVRVSMVRLAALTAVLLTVAATLALCLAWVAASDAPRIFSER